MQSNFSVFRERLAEACRARNMTRDKLYAGISIGGRRAVDLDFAGVKSLDIPTLAQIADKLDVSIDWLLGRSNVMSVMEMPEPPEPKAKKTAA